MIHMHIGKHRSPRLDSSESREYKKQLLIGQEMYTGSKLSQSGSVSVFVS